MWLTQALTIYHPWKPIAVHISITLHSSFTFLFISDRRTTRICGVRQHSDVKVMCCKLALYCSVRWLCGQSDPVVMVGSIMMLVTFLFWCNLECDPSYSCGVRWVLIKSKYNSKILIFLTMNHSWLLYKL